MTRIYRFTFTFCLRFTDAKNNMIVFTWCKFNGCGSFVFRDVQCSGKPQLSECLAGLAWAWASGPPVSLSALLRPQSQSVSRVQSDSRVAPPSPRPRNECGHLNTRHRSDHRYNTRRLRVSLTEARGCGQSRPRPRPSPVEEEKSWIVNIVYYSCNNLRPASSGFDITINIMRLSIAHNYPFYIRRLDNIKYKQLSILFMNFKTLSLVTWLWPIFLWIVDSPLIWKTHRHTEPCFPLN